MKPALRTQFKDGLDFDAGKLLLGVDYHKPENNSPVWDGGLKRCCPGAKLGRKVPTADWGKSGA